MPLSDRFEKALHCATRLHSKQTRKGTSIPYISHLLAVASLALEHGANEDEAIAALLHDAAEDQGGQKTLKKIEKRFGETVALIVEQCSDSFENPKPPWRQRKESYLAHLKHAPRSVLLVSACDKLHNARSILSDYRIEGETVWQRFTGGKEGTLWYYRSLAGVFKAVGPERCANELQHVVTEIERLSA